MSWRDWIGPEPKREVRRAYDAAKSNHQRKVPSDTRSGNGLLDAARDSPRRWARHLDENVDLVTGLLTALALRTSSITVAPAVRTRNGELAADANARLSELWDEQSDEIELSGLYSESELRQLLARTWLRDGEVFALPSEAAPGVEYGAVPFGIQALEPDYLPFEDLKGRDTIHGVTVSQAGRPLVYHFLSSHPGQGPGHDYMKATKMVPVPASQVHHLARRDRLHQIRGVTALASIITRIDDLRDMEESERIAARLAAAACASITRSPDLATATDTAGAADERSMYFEGGMVFDDLLPGEKVELLNPTRPNPNAIPWRKMQVQAIAAGVDANASTVGRDYSGSYSSQRQELVESAFLVNERLTRPFVSKLWRPIWRGFAAAAVRHGHVSRAELRLVDTDTITRADFNSRGVSWIDMLKEVQAEDAAVRAGFKSRAQVIRERGGDPRRVDDELTADNYTPPLSSTASQMAMNDA